MALESARTAFLGINKLIALPTDQLLDQFGGGGHAPGSGSAAALMALLSAQLVSTVCKISSGRGDDARFRYVLERIEARTIPELKRLFQKDAEDFDKVIEIRVQRDKENDPVIKRRLRDQALRLLEDSTDLVFAIADICIQLVEFGLIVFDGGSKKVRGDSGAAIGSAIAGAMSSVFIINLNLTSFQNSRWAIQRRYQAEKLYENIIAKQEDAFRRIVTLQPEVVDAIQPDLF